MANSVPWHAANKKLQAPATEDKLRFRDLQVFNNGNVSVSCWQLTPDELTDIIQNGGKVYLAVLFGKSQPPCFVGSEDSVRSVVIDYGSVWKRSKGEKV